MSEVKAIFYNIAKGYNRVAFCFKRFKDLKDFSFKEDIANAIVQDSSPHPSPKKLPILQDNQYLFGDWMRETAFQAEKSGLLQYSRSSSRALRVSTSPCIRYSSSVSRRGGVGFSMDVYTFLIGQQ